MKKPIQKVSYKGGCFHVFNRGNHKRNIFLEDSDYLFYLKKTREYKEKCKISIICYCLMPNHFHLLLKQDSDVPIYKFMQILHTSYSMYFNRKYNKVGHLFQGKYKQKEVDKDEYLLQLSSYIHFNPVKDGLIDNLDDYQWSSYPDYIGTRNGTLCDKELALYGRSSKEYRKITEEEMRDKILMKDLIFEVR